MRPPDGSPGIEKPFDQSTLLMKSAVEVELPAHVKLSLFVDVAAADVATL